MSRQCGACTLCCKLLPVHDGVLINGKRMQGNLDKPAGERCRYQRHTGCTVYNTALMPACCKMWNCRWLGNDDTGDLSRPDRSHYVIDIMPDYVTVVDNATGARQNVEVVQIWIDPKYPTAHRDPALRRWLERKGRMALVRFNSSEAIHLMPPSVASDGQWHELEGKSEGREHSLAEIANALST